MQTRVSMEVSDKRPKFNRLVTNDKLSYHFFSRILNNVECIEDRSKFFDDFKKSKRTLYFASHDLLPELNTLIDGDSRRRDIGVFWFFGPFEHLVLQSDILTSEFGFTGPSTECKNSIGFYRAKLEELMREHPLPYCDEVLYRCFIEDCGNCPEAQDGDEPCPFYCEGFKPREILGMKRYIKLYKLFDPECLKDLVVDARYVQKYIKKLEDEDFDLDSVESTNLFD